MQEHGENWTSILKSMRPKSWKPDLLAALSKIAGDIDDVRVEQLGSYQVVQLRHGSNGHERWFDASQESDGTLRCAGILTALLQEPPLSLVGIEEPELTIHPGAISVLYDFFVEASKHSQVLLTTHSPDGDFELDSQCEASVSNGGGASAPRVRDLVLALPASDGWA